MGREAQGGVETAPLSSCSPKQARQPAIMWQLAPFPSICPCPGSPMLLPNTSTTRSSSLHRLVMSTGAAAPARKTWQPCGGGTGWWYVVRSISCARCACQVMRCSTCAAGRPVTKQTHLQGLECILPQRHCATTAGRRRCRHLPARDRSQVIPADPFVCNSDTTRPARWAGPAPGARPRGRRHSAAEGRRHRAQHAIYSTTNTQRLDETGRAAQHATAHRRRPCVSPSQCGANVAHIARLPPDAS